MKTPLHLFCAVLFFILISPTLGRSQGKAKLYRVTITTTNHYRIKCILHSVTDSTLTYVLNTSRAIRLLRNRNPQVYSLKADEIRHVSIRRRGLVVRSTLIGLGVGLAVSAALSTFSKPGEVGTFVPPIAIGAGARGNSSTFRPGVALLNGLRWVMIYAGPVVTAGMGTAMGLVAPGRSIFVDSSYPLKAHRSSIEPFTYAYQVRGGFESVAD